MHSPVISPMIRREVEVWGPGCPRANLSSRVYHHRAGGCCGMNLAKGSDQGFSGDDLLGNWPCSHTLLG